MPTDKVLNWPFRSKLRLSLKFSWALLPLSTCIGFSKQLLSALIGEGLLSHPFARTTIMQIRACSVVAPTVYVMASLLRYASYLGHFQTHSISGVNMVWNPGVVDSGKKSSIFQAISQTKNRFFRANFRKISVFRQFKKISISQAKIGYL